MPAARRDARLGHAEGPVFAGLIREGGGPAARHPADSTAPAAESESGAAGCRAELAVRVGAREHVVVIGAVVEIAATDLFVDAGFRPRSGGCCGSWRR